MSALTLTPRALYVEVAEQLRQRIFRRELEPGTLREKLFGNGPCLPDKQSLDPVPA